MMKWIYDDGGRSNYYKGSANDCVIRAIAIATNRDYKEISNLVNEYINRTEYDEKYIKNAHNGVAKEIAHKLLNDLGWKWIPTMYFAKGCTTHLKKDELPSKGTFILSVSKHLTVLKDGIIYDTYDPSRNGTRCVYGYFQKMEET